MRDSVHCLTRDEPDQERIRTAILAMVLEVQKYVRVIGSPRAGI